MLRSLVHYRHLNIAVLFGVAVAATVMTGAFMVGDSHKESLKAMTFDRLGHIDHAVVPDHMVSADLVDRIGDRFSGQVAGAVLLRGSASGPEKRASGVQIIGVEADFADLFPGGEDATSMAAALGKESGQFSPSAVLNESLVRQLGVSLGDEVVLAFENPADINRDSAYGEKDSGKVIQRLRITVHKVISDRGMGRFSLVPHQDLPLTVFVPMKDLQRSLDRKDQINAVFFGQAGQGSGTSAERDALVASLGLEDLTAVIRTGEDYFSLESPAFFLGEALAEVALGVAEEMGLQRLPISSYLANQLTLNDRLMPYSLTSALDLSHPLASVVASQGTAQAGAGEVLLSQWAADDLGAKLGDNLSLTYFGVDPGEQLIEETEVLKLVGILPMQGVVIDPDLTPEFPGIEDADNMGDWDPPFEMNTSLIRDKDETFWDNHKTSSKIYVSPQTGEKMWGSRFGFLTAIRFGAGAGMSLEQTRDQFEAALVKRLSPETAGLPLIALKELGLDASNGSTDFTGLFIGLSFFIIISAVLLVSLFFRLSVAQRGSEIGILKATGYTQKAIRNRLLKEGVLLCALGSAVGSAGGLLYAAAVMAGLRNWWYLGTSELYFHFKPQSLVMGFAIAIVVSLLAILSAVREAGKQTVTQLVTGHSDLPQARGGARARKLLIVSLVLTALMFLASFFLPPTGLFFGVGTCLLLAGLSFVATRVADRRVANEVGGLFSMATRNMARQAGRSLVCVSLVASACYVIVAVGLFRAGGKEDTDLAQSGAGGFFLEATAEVPVFDLKGGGDGYDQELADLLEESDALAMRLRGGDDASCLNLYTPREPRILGVPDLSRLHDRFSFKDGGDGEQPWDMLAKRFDDGAIPVIGDANSMQWILKLKLGGDLIMKNEAGDEVKLRLVGSLQKGSIFQSELLMSEAHFLELFPSLSGFRYFLFASKSEQREGLAAALERNLADYGLDAMLTADKIEAFHAIELTYISIFQMLGGLGLLLGTLGLGAVIYRNAFERRSEFAALRAFGYQGKRITRLLLAENTVLIVSGIVIGTLSAVISMAPTLIANRSVPAPGILVGTLVAVFLVGLSASIWAVRKVRAFPLLASLRAK